MPIIVGHQPSLGTSGRVALETGRGQRAEAALQRALAERARVQNIALERQRLQAGFEQQVRLRALAHKLGLEEAYTDAAIRDVLGARAGLRGVALGQLQSNLQYSAEQKRNIQQLERAAQAVADDPNLSQPQKEEAMQQIIAMRLGIRPLSAAETKAPPLAQELGSRVTPAQDERGRFSGYFIRQPDGEIDFKSVKAAEDPWSDPKLALDLYTRFSDAMTTTEPVIETIDGKRQMVGEKTIPPKPEEVFDRIRQFQQAVGAFTGQQGAAAAVRGPQGDLAARLGAMMTAKVKRVLQELVAEFKAAKAAGRDVKAGYFRNEIVKLLKPYVNKLGAAE